MTDFTMNRIANSDNRFQQIGKYDRVLCVCSAGLLRSPTAAYVLSQEPFNKNTRACGITKEFALIPFDAALAHWADEIVCMEKWQSDAIKDKLKEYGLDREVIVLGIQDTYEYRNPDLISKIKEKYKELHK